MRLCIPRKSDCSSKVVFYTKRGPKQNIAWGGIYKLRQLLSKTLADRCEIEYNNAIMKSLRIRQKSGETVAKLERYIQVGQKRLRCGYTTGTCSAAAARGAAEYLLSGKAPTSIFVDTPAGITVEIDVEELRCEDGVAVCSVRKDGGDDPDITDGILLSAGVRLIEKQKILIDGGQGVGRVTRPGLDQPVGNSAINSVPRRMIKQQLSEVAKKYNYFGGFSVVISIPEGEKLAQQTFNPRLGIVGGLSVLGTSGIVRPMSEEALMASIHAELDMKKAEGVTDLLVSPGNYGADFCRDSLGLNLAHAVQCSNYIGDTLDYAAALGFRSLLMVGHIGKLVKCAAGVMNTHSRVADGRMETLAAYSAVNGVEKESVQAILHAATTDAALEILQDYTMSSVILKDITDAAGKHLQRRAGASMKVEALIFSNRWGVLGMTDGAEELLKLHGKESTL